MWFNYRTIRSGPRHIEAHGVKVVSLVVDVGLRERPGRGNERRSHVGLTPLRIFVLSDDGVRKLKVPQARGPRVGAVLALSLLGPVQFWLARIVRRRV
jgi:hypothetical protein